MSDEDVAVHTTGQEDESTQQDVTPSDQSTDTQGDENLTAEERAEKAASKDPNGWAIKRIGALTQQRHEAERKAETSAQEAARYKAILDQMQKDGTEVPKTDAQAPDIDALVDKRATEKAQQQAITERGVSVAKVGAESFPDFQQAVVTLDALGITQDQVQNLLGMEDAHKVIYQLGKNPEEAARILALPPVQQGRELERLALKSAQPAAKAVSNAPNPITPVDSTVSSDKSPAKMSTEEWMAWRNKNAKTVV